MTDYKALFIVGNNNSLNDLLWSLFSSLTLILSQMKQTDLASS